MDWDKVVDELNKRAQAIQEVIDDSKTEILEKPKSSSVEDNPKPEYQYEPDEATGWLIAAYIFALLVFGIAFGFVVWNDKVKLSNGEKVYKYKDSHRYMGLGAMVLAIISIFVWMFAIN